MEADGHLDWQGAATTLDWWVAAGVDVLVDEAPRDWLAAPPATLAPATPAPAARAVAAPAADAMPGDLAAFATWRHGVAVPEHGWPGDWVASAGPAGGLMVLADCPDRDDGAEGRLFGGDAGRLFERMLAAIGLTRDAVHLSSLCAKRPTAGRLPADAEARLAAIARHHVGLAAPRALLLLGNAASRAVLATDVAATRGRLHSLDHSERETGRDVPVVASFHPRFLLEKPAAKAAAWADLRVLRRAMGI